MPNRTRILSITFCIHTFFTILFLHTFNFFTGVRNIYNFSFKKCILEQAFVVGHDWGAKIAWDLCLFRPDRVRALVNLGVPYQPRSIEFKPTEFFSKIFGEGFYISQFQVKNAKNCFSLCTKKYISILLAMLE